MPTNVRKISGDEADEAVLEAMNTEDFRAIEDYFRVEKKYDFGDRKIIGTGEPSEDNFIVTCEFDDSNKDTILEATLTFRNGEHADTTITRDFIEDNEIIRTEVYEIQDGEVVLRETLD